MNARWRLDRGRERLRSAGRRVASWLREPGWGAAMAPLALTAILSPWLWLCWRNYTHAMVYRDSTMFLYVAWCVRHGERLYQTVAMPDGPFVCLLHMVMQALGGEDLRGFRAVDIELQMLGSGVVGALLVPRHARHRVVSCLVWAIVSASLWATCIFHWGFADSAQRESYYALFIVLGLALWFVAGECERRGSAVSLVLGGFLIALPAFGKQTTALYALVGYGALALDAPSPARSRLSRMALAGAGMALSAVAMLGFVALFGSLKGYRYWSFDYILTFYQFIERKPVLDVALSMPKDLVPPALMCLVAGALAVGRGFLPARTLGFAVAPMLALTGALLQRKGWPYHYVPVMAITEAFLVLLVIRAWHHEDPQSPRQLWGAVAVALTVFVGLWYFQLVQSSVWLDKRERKTEDAELTSAREAATFIANRTGAGDRVFYWGHLIEIPLLAKRLPATPYVVPWLVFGGAGSSVDYKTLTPAERENIEAMRARLASDLCARLTTSPPVAMAMTQSWCVEQDCVKELARLCPSLPGMLSERYGAPRMFGNHHVYLLKPLP